MDERKLFEYDNYKWTDGKKKEKIRCEKNGLVWCGVVWKRETMIRGMSSE